MSTPIFGVIEPGRSYVERVGAYGFILDPRQNLAIVQTPNGFFLPGGGSDPRESLEETLKREINEELGLQVTAWRFTGQAIQYHWSDHYREYFKKVGSFYLVEVHSLSAVKMQIDHQLHWITIADGTRTLTQEFQRWATMDAFKS